MKNFIYRFKSLRAFNAVMNDPTQTDKIFELADLGRAHRGPLLDLAVDSIANQPHVEELYQQNYLPDLPPIEELAKYPDGSLGREYARHMQTNGLEPDFYPEIKGSGRERYFTERGRKVHDLWHVLTGYDTSIESEIGLQGFTLAQLKSPFSAVLISAGFLHTLTKAPEKFSAMMELTFDGFEMGRNAKLLFGEKIEERLGENLEALRAEFNIKTISAKEKAS